MAIRAYDELYLPGAQNVLGHAVDFAVMTLAIEPNIFGNALAVSESAKQFSEGNPRYIAGMNGCELARFILDDVGVAYRESADEMFLDKSPEYWAGWALAYYQWFTALSFMEILRAMSLNDIIRMYPLYHEMDLSHFVEQMDRFMKETYPQTRLRDRSNCLSRDSAISTRPLQSHCTSSAKRSTARWKIYLNRI